MQTVYIQYIPGIKKSDQYIPVITMSYPRYNYLCMIYNRYTPCHVVYVLYNCTISFEGLSYPIHILIITR